VTGDGEVGVFATRVGDASGFGANEVLCRKGDKAAGIGMKERRKKPRVATEQNRPGNRRKER
jgi:hypothetical protein